VSVWQRPLRGLTLGLVLVVVAGAFEALAVATIMPAVVRDLSGMELYGWAFSGFTLTNLIGISLGGSATRIGTVRAFLLGVAVFCAGLIVAALAPAMIVMVLGRLLQGFGSGLLYTVAYASIPRAYHSDLRPRMLATLSTAWVLPGLIGPGVAGVVASALSWRWVFGGLLPMPLIAAALVVPQLRALPPGPPAALRPGVLLYALQLAVGVGCLLSGLSQAQPLLAALLIVSGAALALRALAKLLPEGTLRARAGRPAAIASMALITFGFFGCEAFVPLALTHVRGVPVAWSGMPLTAAAITWTAGAWLPVRIAGRVARSTLVIAGLAVLALGVAGTGLVLSPSVPAETVILSWSIAGLGMGVAFTTTSAGVLDQLEGSSSDHAAASLQLVQALGAALATGIGGAIVASRFAGDPPTFGIALVDGLMVLFVVLSAITARGIPGRA
jgi:MFS family permease